MADGQTIGKLALAAATHDSRARYAAILSYASHFTRRGIPLTSAPPPAIVYPCCSSAFEWHDPMGQTDSMGKSTLSARAIVAVIVLAIAIAVACFTAVMLLPESDKPFFDSPLRSVLAGVGLLGVAWPLLIAGSRLREHAAGSPYFEEGFIAGVLSLFGYVILLVGLICLALAAYALLERLLMARWPIRRSK